MYMKAYLEKLKAYVETHPIQFDDDCDFPALDSLYWHYSECHNMSNERTKKASGICKVSFGVGHSTYVGMGIAKINGEINHHVYPCAHLCLH